MAEGKSDVGDNPMNLPFYDTIRLGDIDRSIHTQCKKAEAAMKYCKNKDPIMDEYGDKCRWAQSAFNNCIVGYAMALQRNCEHCETEIKAYNKCKKEKEEGGCSDEVHEFYRCVVFRRPRRY
eukprot:CAMPEP_0113896472 /NCGR_PEP_ID=MMETSP0780_2-20120614/18048_1 /TAXON_ID=652834 /ORGANISM="Palpitomonas bilix" /LENGTH=121 /DNA_ID=CAMNT_0000887639 /DNA_START=21 /DNA_END=386 /DNA_ORIENTATION=+ /assembly_acc=CAM_ASM_000599